jgi:hypothetical protein
MENIEQIVTALRCSRKEGRANCTNDSCQYNLPSVHMCIEFKVMENAADAIEAQQAAITVLTAESARMREENDGMQELLYLEHQATLESCDHYNSLLKDMRDLRSENALLERDNSRLTAERDEVLEFIKSNLDACETCKHTKVDFRDDPCNTCLKNHDNTGVYDDWQWEWKGLSK